MSRERISAANPDAPKFRWIFKEIKSKTRGLFGNGASSLSQRDQDYLMVAAEIRKFREGKSYQEISIKQLSHFFIIQYRFRFGIDCIDYNWFNFQSTMKKLKDYLNSESCTELGYFLYSSIEKCKDRSFSREEVLTLSTFKRSWYLDELLDRKSKFSGFY